METYGQIVVDNSTNLRGTYQCLSIEDDYRAIRAPRCERSHLEDFRSASKSFRSRLHPIYAGFHPCGTRSHDAAVSNIS